MTRRTRWQAAVAAIMIAVGRAKGQETAPRIVISIPDRKLAVLDSGRLVKIYDVAVGADVSPSPAGTFHVVVRVANPTYYHPGVVIGPGKRNPLGPRWIGLSVKGLGIHGTNAPRSIGRAASHGCIRMRNSDVQELFEQVKVGDLVELCRERTELLAELFGRPPEAVETASAGAAE